MILTWDKRLWSEMSNRAFFGTSEGKQGILIAILLALCGIPLGLASMWWATGAWGLQDAPGMREVMFLGPFLSMVIVGIAWVTWRWRVCNNNIGRCELQGAVVEQN